VSTWGISLTFWWPATDKRRHFAARIGRLAVLRAGRDTFAIKEWLAADADARTPKDGSLGNGVIRRGLRASGSSVL
jgi:hypothetical protein